eukprot:SAG25_NODE_5090_length_703_cov_3.024834_1_plen_192_part_10
MHGVSIGGGSGAGRRAGGAELGACVLHGLRGNPLRTLAQQLRLGVTPLREHCPIYMPSGAPVDAALDRAVEARFNRMLALTDRWREAAAAAAVDSKDHRLGVGRGGGGGGDGGGAMADEGDGRDTPSGARMIIAEQGQGALGSRGGTDSSSAGIDREPEDEDECEEDCWQNPQLSYFATVEGEGDADIDVSP